MPDSTSRLPKLVTILKKTFSCDLCDYKTAFKSGIRNHINERHIFQVAGCKLCRKSFSSALKLKIHMRKHTKPNIYKCLLCFLDYKRYPQFSKHIEQKHQRQKSEITLVCDICGSTFYIKSRMDRHMKSEHIGPFKCFIENCFRQFSTSFVRRYHHLSYHSQDREVTQLRL